MGSPGRSRAADDCSPSTPQRGSYPGRGAMIRLAMLVDSPSKRAHANAAGRLALGLAETGRVETTLLCYSADPRPSWLTPEVRIHRLGASRASRSLYSFIRYLRTEQPDVLITRQVHANFVGLAAAWAARVPPGWKGKLLLVQDSLIELAHASNWRDNKWLAKATYRFADGLLVPSPAMRENIVSWCGLDPSSVVLVPNPIPKFSGPIASPPHPWLQDGESPVFINVTNMLPFKRLDLLIEAFADVRQSHDARLLILGDGPARPGADALIRKFGLGGDAETVGWIENPLQFAAHAWALVHSSDEEGFAQVLIEAMSVDCPVITTDSRGGGPRFVTGNGKYGVLVPRGDRVKLAGAMTDLLRPDLRAQYSKVGKERADELSPEASAIALVSFLAQRFGLS